jgi:hypothetical protein
MTKTVDNVSELVRMAKHPFRGSENRTAKCEKSRYERRKIKGYLKLGNWLMEAEA